MTDDRELDRVVLSLDGSHACALLGANLQEGEADFEPIEGWPHATYAAERKAAFIAFRRLIDRLKLAEPNAWVPYYLGEGLQS